MKRCVDACLRSWFQWRAPPDSMSRDIFGIALLIGVLVIAPLGATSPYFLITPGGTYEIGTQPRPDGPPRLTRMSRFNRMALVPVSL